MHLYIPVEPPPTPAPSPGPSSSNQSRLQYLSSILHTCTPSELRFISLSIAPLLKRDFLRDLPLELALHVLSYLEDPLSLIRASQVSKTWRDVVRDDGVWRRMCMLYQFPNGGVTAGTTGCRKEPLKELEEFADKPMDPALEWLALAKRRSLEKRETSPFLSSSFARFKYHYITLQNWRYGGHLLREYSVPMPFNSEQEGGVITSVALDSEWVVVASASSKIFIFSARTGVLHRVLVGHNQGVWSVGLVSRGGKPPRRSSSGVHSNRGDDHNLREDEIGSGAELHSGSFLPPSYKTALGLDVVDIDQNNSEGGLEDDDIPSSPCGASEGWGQPNAIVVSAGCDRVVKVWDVDAGNCIYTLDGHTATIRCLKVLHRSPTAITGARDSTLRVWDVQKGRMLRVLVGHTDRVRCVDVCGRKAVSGSYDGTCRLWNIDTGECIHVLAGHSHQVYCVVFNGVYIASGGLDTVVRVWSAESGLCLSILTGHTALVCQLQLSPHPKSRGRQPWQTEPEPYSNSSPPFVYYPGQTHFTAHPSTMNVSTSPQHDVPYTRPILATGGSDGRVITYDIESRQVLHRIAAHDAAVTALQFDEHFIVSAGSDGRVRVFDTRTGRLIRDWYGTDGGRGSNGYAYNPGAINGYGYGVENGGRTTDGRSTNGRCENVWKVVFGGSLWAAGYGLKKTNQVSSRGRDICAVMCRKPGGRTVIEIWKMCPDTEQLSGKREDGEDSEEMKVDEADEVQLRDIRFEYPR